MRGRDAGEVRAVRGAPGAKSQPSRPQPSAAAGAARQGRRLGACGCGASMSSRLACLCGWQSIHAHMVS